ncbi:hypothetical protein HCN44_009040 [Aphidius gifuensis]|uniref:Signal transducing adapter molecule 1 n=2 Tax=Aphidius gifuensis TaxID=684658 RepID=A0A835CU36_APHGI|nr:signal transducing adapter molecule 1 isoform X1 [Aphidius gifuensis]KAF7996002.1 hypothetical protein HCN44_009040 [Aphidius gifuensis]
MGLFGNSTSFDADVEKATNEINTSEDWATILEICDNVGNSKQNAKDCLRSITKRLNAADPHIVMQALTLLDACSSNCGKNFHLEIASRDFEAELKKLLSRAQPQIIEKTKILLKKWAENDFKSDSQLNLIPSLYNKLKQDGINFSLDPAAPSPAAVFREEQDLAKAIQLSLNDNKQHSNYSKTMSLYPNVSVHVDSISNVPEGRKVRALYDFEAAEDNELSFAAGDIIYILDDSDANWWKGLKGKLEGLFPSNFVTADLSVELNHIAKLDGNKKSVQFANAVEVKTLKQELEITEVEINEEKIDRLLNLLHEADPQTDVTDPFELLDLEEQVMAMGPLIDAALEKVDRRHAQLTQLSSDLVDAVNLYRTLQREPPSSIATYHYQKIPGPMIPPISPYLNQPSSHIYNRMSSHHQIFPKTFIPNVGSGMSHTVEYGNSTIPPQHYHGITGIHQQLPFGHSTELQSPYIEPHNIPSQTLPSPRTNAHHTIGQPQQLLTQRSDQINLSYPNTG